MAELFEVSVNATFSDDSNASLDTDVNIPPSKKLKHRVKSHKSKAAKKSRKGTKRKHVTSSSSSGLSQFLTNSESDSSDHVTIRKKKCHKKSKLGQKGVLPRDHSRMNHLLDVFQRHYKSLLVLIKTCPVIISSTLYSNGFISEDTLNEVITGQDSQLKKAALLLCDVRAHLKVNPEMLMEFVGVLEQEKSFDDLTNQIKGM